MEKSLLKFQKLHLVFVALALPQIALAFDVEDQLFQTFNANSSTHIGISLNGSSGNEDSREWAIKAGTAHSGQTFRALLMGELQDSETNNVRTDESTAAHLRGIYRMTQQHAVEIIAEHRRDVLKGLSRQRLGGIGYRWEKVPSDELSTSAAIGIGVIRTLAEFESRSQSEDEQDTRGNLYVAVNQPLSKDGAQLSVTAIYRPVYEETSDRRLVGVSTLSAPISNSLSMQFSVEYKHDSEPEVMLKRRDLEYSTSVRYSF